MNHTRMARPALDQRGIALPLVLMLTVFLTISVGAGFIIAGNEHTVGVDHDAQLKAFAVAQQGVERYLTDVTSLPATFPDSQTFSVTGGTAKVTLRRVRTAAGVSDIFAVTSIGDATSSNLRRSASTPVAERTVSQFVLWQTGTMDTKAAFTTLDSLNNKNGSSGTVNGNDLADPTSGCGGGGTAIPGLAAPTGGLTSNGETPITFLDGSTGNVPEDLGTYGPSGTAKDSVDVDWAGILGGSIAPDFTLNRTVTPKTGSWPTSTQFNNWPVVLVKGDVTNSDNLNGKGILIVTGNVDFSNLIWHGVVLVGGAVTLSGSQARVYGTLYTGLNVKLGQNVGLSTMNGNETIQYNSCDISKALLKFGGWRRVANTWADNWPTYTVP